MAVFAAAVLALGVAACGGDDTVGGGGNGEVTTARGGPVTGDLTVSNWPGYIDPGGRGTVAEFQDETGVSVNYVEDINDNEAFFGKLQPQLEQGQSGGRSIFVLTDWMAKQMYDLGYLQEIDHDDLPTVFANLSPSLESPSFDPERKFSVPWQSGMTGIWVDTSQAPDVRSVSDLFDPRYAGKVTMLTEMRDTVGSVLLGEGIDPEDATKDQALAAIEKVEKASRDGQIRRFTGNEYTRDIARGDSVAILGWSGDAVQLIADNENIAYSQPEEGFMIFTDSMQIPVGAPNAFTAQKMIDFVYQPEIQAAITEYVNYVPPVKGAREILQDRSPEVAENELIFPDLAQAHNFKTFSEDEEAEIEAAFQRAIGA